VLAVSRLSARSLAPASTGTDDELGQTSDNCAHRLLTQLPWPASWSVIRSRKKTATGRWASVCEQRPDKVGHGGSRLSARRTKGRAARPVWVRAAGQGGTARQAQAPPPGRSCLQAGGEAASWGVAEDIASPIGAGSSSRNRPAEDRRRQDGRTGTTHAPASRREQQTDGDQPRAHDCGSSAEDET